MVHGLDAQGETRVVGVLPVVVARDQAAAEPVDAVRVASIVPI
jgi:hypothetical protein